MPTRRVGLRHLPWVSGVQRGIIRESALCELCRHRHNSHWSGHPSRLNRLMSTAFGSEEYAKEELVADLASCFMAAHKGIPYNPAQTAAYVASWIK